MTANSSTKRDRSRSRWECRDELRNDPNELRVELEPISPELVLVDPELARRVRPLAVGYEAPRRESTEPVAPVRRHDRSDAHPRRRTRLRIAAASVAGATAIALVTIATAAVPLSDDRPYFDASSPVDVATEPGASLPTVSGVEDPKPTRRGTAATVSPPTPHPGTPTKPPNRAEGVELRWEPVPNAAYYNVILWRDGARLRDYWPRLPRLLIRSRALAPLGDAASEVHWFVYPVEVEAGRNRIGPVHATGTFTPPRSNRMP